MAKAALGNADHWVCTAWDNTAILCICGGILMSPFSFVMLANTRCFFTVRYCGQICVFVLSHLWLCVTPWTVAHQASLFMQFSRQEYWSGLPFPPAGDLLNPRIKPMSLTSLALAGRLFTTAPPGKYCDAVYQCKTLGLCVCVGVCVVKSIQLFFFLGRKREALYFEDVKFVVSSKNWQVWEISLINWSLWLVENWILLFESYGKLKILWSFSISFFSALESLFWMAEFIIQ